MHKFIIEKSKKFSMTFFSGINAGGDKFGGVNRDPLIPPTGGEQLYPHLKKFLL